MNLRPRCREWLPLSTQQLRLRNLIRIQGVNIVGKYLKYANQESYIYYTLHHDKDSDAFYMSESLPQRHLQQKWADIQCMEMLKSNANCVCVKVWVTGSSGEVGAEQLAAGKKVIESIETEEEQPSQTQKRKEPISALTRELTNTCLSPYKLPRPPDDQLLFTWAVYFSGLMHINQQMDAKCKENSLIFHMNGSQFAAPSQFTSECLREQLKENYERYSISVPISEPLINSNKYAINSPEVSRSTSPMALDWQEDLLQMTSRKRYMELNCNSSDVRRSYNLDKLLELQKLQRMQLQRRRESQDIISDIKQLSLHCITKEQLSRKPRTTSLTYHHQNQHSMGRALSVLLAEQQQIDPKTLYQARQLLKSIECCRCKENLLSSEHATYTKRLQQQRQKLQELRKARQELELWLLESKLALEQDKQQLQLSQEEFMLHMRRKRAIVQDVERSMSTLCVELSEIYPIKSVGKVYSICGIPFPDMEAYLSDARYANSVSMENITPMALSAALGYVAHVVQMIAVIMNRPLRNPILHEGSRTRIKDIVKDTPYTNREYPLYTRSSMPVKAVKYAIYLLNQNIAQLCFDITGRRRDLYATMENLSHIFATLAQINYSQRSDYNETEQTRKRTHPKRRLVLDDEDAESETTSNITTGNGCHNESALSDEFLSKSHSSVDMNHVEPPLPAMLALPPTVEHMSEKFMQLLPPSSAPRAIKSNHRECGGMQERVCRSVGSYSDCDDDMVDFKQIMQRQSYSNSDSNITLRRDH